MKRHTRGFTCSHRECEEFSRGRELLTDALLPSLRSSSEPAIVKEHAKHCADDPEDDETEWWRTTNERESTECDAHKKTQTGRSDLLHAKSIDI
jgi:hypothetical protein